ncbi:glycoside hydrolase family 70 protein [Streptococcus sanguinis]|uniref:glycoside hydrolase family 70 protein n=1 Tax=Streptococcus sanguinis TaxID=1305 RepID=UPI00228469D3|nr:glycoside hydrolase family 70 protein [Streptococcus sanguinis]MCY7027701.1 KxYKxGKxW signal peptide domain-containing protein [Streptococcus sanguinis]
MMEKKIHYKMHKVKKNWVAIGVTTLALIVAPKVLGLEAGLVHADDVKQVAVQEPTAAQDSGSGQPVQVQANSASQLEAEKATSADKVVDAAVASEKTAETAANTEAAVQTDAQEPAKPAVAEAATTEKAAVAEEAKAANVTSETAKPEAANQDRQVSPATADKQAKKTVTDKIVANPKVAKKDRLPEPAQRQGAIAERMVAAQAQAAPVNAEHDDDVLSHIKTIDGKKYYVQDDGTVKKNFAVELNGKVLYFDAETGALVDSAEYQFQQGTSSLNNEFSRMNAFHGTTEKDIETVDGYLTADTWYRPKAILKDGKTWTQSTETDLRPLLMAWWPDKQTQVSYLNYMNQQGLGAGAFENKVEQAILTGASQQVQRKIEERIGKDGDTKWLRTLMGAFVKTQPNWNIKTESETTGTNKDHLQGGALLYTNSEKTSHANSKYRILNRTPTNQTGTPKYFIDKSNGGYEFLLANDFDNSNPAVQAEQLNWLHFMMNFGSIVANDPTANFDGVRVDAVDNVNADLLQIASDYFKSRYKVGESEEQAIKHLSILEAWSDNDPDYNKDTKGAQLPIDNKLRLSLLYSFMRKLSIRSGVEPTITNSLNDRSTEKKNGERMANYIFVRAHDSEVQTVIADIIRENINPNTDGLTFTMDELKQAFKIYNEDMRKADKKYTQFNIPTAHALMLSNKDSITRVYYGDLYTDDGQYMEKKSPYHDAIDALLRARIKYVAGGQDMKVTYMGVPREADKWSYNGILTSVRYGTGANEATDEGTEETRTQGMAVIASNNPNLKLNEWDKLRVNMGAAHKNQYYRPVLLTTKDGISRYLTDEEVPQSLWKKTDANGILTFDMNDIAGYSNVQVSGYLAVWVPVGAKADQDARVTASKKKNASGQVYESSAALDSQLIYEGFSNFQDFATRDDQYTNKVIAKNVNLFKEWGVTSFELPPQYVSSQDGTFLDSIIQNGYAFEDRYDMAMSKNNKYGSLNDLLNALRALHSVNIQAIADWVPDQIYNLPGKEVVTATRVNNYGTYREGAEIKEKLYVANTRTNGTDYQGKYGGAFLDELKAKYPEIFERVQISNGQKMTTDEKITKWSAKHFNGTNILGRGAYYVLKDWASNEYLNNKNGEMVLPKQLVNKKASTGFVSDANGTKYYSTSGYEAKNAFIQDENGNWYYFNNRGYLVTGAQEIDGKQVYFLKNGIQLRDSLREDENGNQYYYDKTGAQVLNRYYTTDGQNWRYFDAKGVMARGLVTMGGNQQFFDQNGYQVKGKIARAKDGKLRYFDKDSGNAAANRFAQGDNPSDWYYFGADGVAVTGLQKLGQQTLYFDQDGKQVKGKIVTLADNSIRYFDANSGEMAVGKFAEGSKNEWYYFDQAGKAVIGLQKIGQQTLYFDQDGKQVKGKVVTLADKSIRYFDANSGEMAVSKFAEGAKNEWYYFDQAGKAVTGLQKIGQQTLYFDQNGKQVKGQLVTLADKSIRYFDANSGEMAANKFVEGAKNEWYYFDQAGKAVTGLQQIGQQTLYFDQNGKQVKGKIVYVNGANRYFDANSGEMARNKWIQLEDGSWMYFDRNGRGRRFGWN